MQYNLTEHVKGPVTFEYYRKGELIYKTHLGLMFSVPVTDTGDGTFLPTDKGLLYMRWIRKALEDQKHDQVA